MPPSSSHAAAEAIRNRVVLERACVQFSAPISHAAPQDAFREAEGFLSGFAKEFPHACARALVYRVECSEEGDDRLASWLLLDHALRLGIKEQKALRDEERRRRRDPDHPATTIVADLRATVKYNVLVDALGELLPKLIRHRWDEARAATGAGASAHDELHKHRQPAYEAMRVGWTRSFVNPLLTEVRAACEDIRSPAGPQESKDITPPWFLVDACWKLRRERPRPAAAAYVRRLFFEASPVPEGATTELHAIRSAAHSSTIRSALYHSRVMEWVSMYEGSKGACCERCDVWTHSGATCKAAPEHMSHLPTPTIADSRRGLARFLRDDADVSSPSFAARVVDEACSMIQAERSCEQLLAWYDQLRGSVTSASARAALELLGSYRVQPSWLIDFESARRDIVCDIPTMILRDTPSMLRFMAELEGKQRRLREGRNVRAAVRVIALEFAALISNDLYFVLSRVRSNGEFVFAAVGLESYPGQFKDQNAGGRGKKRGGKKGRGDDGDAEAAAAAAKRAAEDAASMLLYTPERLRQSLAEHEDLLRYKAELDVLCRHCLGAGHSSKRCPKAYEIGYYDLNVAKAVVGTMPEKKWLHEEIIQARLLTKSSAPAELRFRFAVFVFAGKSLDANPPVCQYCSRENKMALGHNREDCKFATESVIEQRFQTGAAMLRLMPHLAEDTLNRERDMLKRRHAELVAAEARGDEDAIETKKRAHHMKDRDVKDMSDALKWLKAQEPKVAPAVHEQLKHIDEAMRLLKMRVGAEAQRDVAHVSLLPAIGLLRPDAVQDVLDVTGNAAVTASRVFNDATFPAEDAWVLAITRHAFQGDEGGAGAEAAARLVSDIREACVNELRREVSLADLAGERTQLARHAWERKASADVTTYGGVSAPTSGPSLAAALTRFRGVIDDVRHRADRLRHVAALARKSAAEQTRRQDWSSLSQPTHGGGDALGGHSSRPQLHSSSQLAAVVAAPRREESDHGLFEAPPGLMPPPPRSANNSSYLRPASSDIGTARSGAGGSQVPPPPIPASSHGGSHIPPPPSIGGSTAVPPPPVGTPGPPVSVSSFGTHGHRSDMHAPPTYAPSSFGGSAVPPPPKYHRPESSHGGGGGAMSVAGSYVSDVPPPPTLGGLSGPVPAPPVLMIPLPVPTPAPVVMPPVATAPSDANLADAIMGIAPAA